MDHGWTSLCLPVKDLGRSRRFYQALGMELLDEVEGKRVILRNGPFRIALMPFLTEPLLNWRGGDAFATHAAVTQSHPDVSGIPHRSVANESGHEADADSASETCLEALRSEVIERSARPERGRGA